MKSANLRHQSPDPTAIYAKVDDCPAHLGIAVAGRWPMNRPKAVRDYLALRRGPDSNWSGMRLGCTVRVLPGKTRAHITVPGVE
jgi:hypothetical protein